METLIWLLLLGAAMLFGSYVAGSLPLTTKLSENKIRMLNALGAGLLIGTSLMVVIPEGVETIYGSAVSRSTVDPLSSSAHTWTSGEDPLLKRRGPEEKGEEGSEHTAIGLALIIGFALMFTIDQVSSLHLPILSGDTTTTTAEYTELGTVGGGSLERDDDEEEEFGREERQQQQHVRHVGSQPSLAPTIGLVVHAAADGIALGASATHPELSLVVFLAIMLHKAPASFALTSVLLASGMSHVTIRKHLLLFALAAPVGSLLTYIVLQMFSSASTSVANLEYWTGVLLVFSGGTFLYVAMHALQEVSSSHSHGSEKSDRTQVLVILAGMLIPILLSMTHSH